MASRLRGQLGPSRLIRRIPTVVVAVVLVFAAQQALYTARTDVTSPTAGK